MLSFLTIALSLIALGAFAASKVAAASLDRTARISSRVAALLPQTQCRQCGFDGCNPYAEAIARRAHSLLQPDPDSALAPDVAIFTSNAPDFSVKRLMSGFGLTIEPNRH